MIGVQKNPEVRDFHNLAPNSAGPPEAREDDTLTALAGALSELAATTRQQWRCWTGREAPPKITDDGSGPCVWGRRTGHLPLASGSKRRRRAGLIQPGEGDGRLLDQILLEQFVEAIPTRTANWIRYHQPQDLAAAVTLAENHQLAVHREEQPTPAAHEPSVQQEKERERHIPHFYPRDPPSALSPQVPAAASRTSPAQTAPQTLGQVCWRRGRPGRARHGPPQVEVGHVTRVAAPSVPGLTRRAEDWERFCPSRWRASTDPFSTSAGSCPKGRQGTAQWRGSASPSGGRSGSSDTTSWGAHSASARTTSPSSGSTA
ncbi:uncharacterized protein [Nerophis lumbriciformis]|uniref:uncharacterized protein n=1 Tax=Nerophis lumbriciformis TaxID=546530 RepID=UPI002AE005FE|nr:uncharacterized protein LOC133612270 [Nerophis lumbriciformis]